MVPNSSATRRTHQNFRDCDGGAGAVARVQGQRRGGPDGEVLGPRADRAKAKDNEIKQRAKKLATEGKLNPAEEKAALEETSHEDLTERERQVLGKGISNLEFHYLGSAKILGASAKAWRRRWRNSKTTQNDQVMKTPLLSLALAAFIAAPVPALAAGKDRPLTVPDFTKAMPFRRREARLESRPHGATRLDVLRQDGDRLTLARFPLPRWRRVLPPMASCSLAMSSLESAGKPFSYDPRTEFGRLSPSPKRKRAEED